MISKERNELSELAKELNRIKNILRLQRFFNCSEEVDKAQRIIEELAKDREVAEKDKEIARLRAALKPVLDCKVMGAVTAEIEPGKSEYCAAIIEKAQRIYYEG